MVGVFLRLKLRLLAAAMRSPGTAIGAVVAGVLGAGCATAVSAVVVSARWSGHGDTAAALVATLLGVGWLVGPVLLSAVDDSLDPRRLALFPLTARELGAGLLGAALLGIGPVLSAVVCVVHPASAAQGVVGWLLVGPCSLVLLALCIAGSRATTAAAAGLVRGRRGREAAIAIAALAGFGPLLLNLLLLPLLEDRGRVERAGVVARWTPWGAVAAAPGRGLALGLLGLGYAAVLTGLALAFWVRRLHRIEVTPDRSSAPPAVRRVRSAAAGHATGRRQAAFGKELRVLRRDPRRLVGFASSAVIGVAAVGPTVAAGSVPKLAVFLGLVTTLMLALQTANGYGFEGTAFWLELVTMAGRRDALDDLSGRAAVHFAIGAPLALLVTLVLAALSGGWVLAVGAVGVELALSGILLGTGAMISVRLPLALPEKQTNVFAGGDPGRGCLSGLVTLAVSAAGLLAVSPLAVTAVLGRRHLLVQVAVLVAGAAAGVAANRAITAAAAAALVARGPELLEELARTPS